MSVIRWLQIFGYSRAFRFGDPYTCELSRFDRNALPGWNIRPWAMLDGLRAGLARGFAALILWSALTGAAGTAFAQDPPGTKAMTDDGSTPVTATSPVVNSPTVPKNVTPKGVNTWEATWGTDDRAKFSGLMRTYMCLSADPPPECAKRHGEQPSDAATLADIEAVKQEARDNEIWAKLREDWPNIQFTEENVGVIQRRADNREDPEAFEMVGFMLQNGQGMQKDLLESFKIYRKAYENGRKSSGPALAEVFRSMNAAQKQELNIWLKVQGGDAATFKERKLGPPAPGKPAT